MIWVLLGLSFGLISVLIFNLIVAITLVKRLKELNLYKNSKLRNIIEEKAQEQLINNW